MLREAKAGAEKYYVGKRPNRHTLPQDEINQLLVKLAKEGKQVTRLKGGDPCVFGRVGEEAELLVEHGIEFEIIPGVTSAVAVPAYAGIPVTHRNYNSSFMIVTGHEKPEKLDSMIDWGNAARSKDTLIFLMGVAKIDYICQQLIHHGRSPETPVALVRWGTHMEQATLIGTLADIADKVKRANFKPPAVIVIGEVVRLREKLAWFEKKPLFGKRILVTRARAQVSELVEQIDSLGGEAVEFPVIRMQEPEAQQVLASNERAMRSLEQYDWIVLTSVNSVAYFFNSLRRLRLDIRRMQRARFVAVGPQTKEALAARGIYAEDLPADYQAEGVLELLKSRVNAGEKVLLPRGNLARSIIPDTLRKWGLDVTEAIVYENVAVDEGADEVIELFEKEKIHIITFTSSSTVKNFVQAMNKHGYQEKETLLKSVKIACIGPITARTAEEHGLAVDAVAEESTIDSLLHALETL